MEHLIMFVVSFVVVFTGRLCLYISSKRTKKKKKTSHGGVAIEMKYLSYKFKIDIAKVDNKKMAVIISFIDAMIIGSVFALVTLITDDITLEFLLGLVLVFVAIYVLYELLGRILKKKGFEKDEL